MYKLNLDMETPMI